MPAIAETLALPAPPAGGLKDATPSSMEIITIDPSTVIKVSEKATTPVASQTHSIGMIHPPPDIRSIVDKTATFVARNGPEFEKRILATNKGNAKFNFLNPGDPYHAYYRHKVSENQEPAAPPPSAASVEAREAAAEKSAKQQMALLPPPVAMQAPEPELYTVRPPEHISGLELDIIKLTAQFVARNGKNFLTGLTTREHANAQFYFLKPTHSHFSFFTAMADAYSKVLMPPKSILEKLKKDVEEPMTVLERSLARLEWEKSQEQQRKRAEDELEAEREQMAMIDWHDFVVVETIDFTEEEEVGLPQPMTLEEIIRQSKKLAADEELAEEDKAAVARSTGVEMAEEREDTKKMDEEELTLVREGLQAANLGENDSQDQEDMEMEDEAPIRVVRNWKRPEERNLSSAGQGAHDPTQFVVSPITGELIPVSGMAEHIRISLIDPKYKEQKERMLAKVRENTLAMDDEIGRNIVSLARTRPDIFGTTEEEISNAVTLELEKKTQKELETDHVVWDGHTGSIGRTANQALTAGTQLPGILSAPPIPADAAPPSIPPPPGRAPAPAPPPFPAPPSTLPPGMLMRPPPGMMMQAPSGPQGPVLPTPTLGYGGQALPPRPSIGPLPPGQVGMPGMPGMMNPLMPGMMPMAAPALEEPPAKKQKVDEVVLVPESQFLASNPGPTRILVTVPHMEGEVSLNGQTVEIAVDSLSESTGAFKERIAQVIGLPANKQKLNGRAGFFKDSNTLAFYNVGPGDVVHLGLKERGGRKK